MSTGNVLSSCVTPEYMNALKEDDTNRETTECPYLREKKQPGKNNRGS